MQPQTTDTPTVEAATERPTLFLIGAERSGTTMLRLMLEHHPKIAFSAEFEYVVDFMDDSGGWPDVDAYADWLSIHRGYRLESLEIDRSLSYRDLVRDFLRQRHEGTGKPIWGATIHRHYDRIPRIWPEARFIYLVRDGRDVARSRIGMGWAGNVYCGADDWIRAEEAWERFRRTLDPDRYIEVRFEDIIERPDEELGRVCAFAGVEFDRAMYDYADDSTYEMPDPKLTYQWRRKQSPREVGEVESRIGDRLRKRGYPLSDHPPVKVSPLRRRWLRLHDRFGRMRFRLKRYGFGLWAQNLIVSRFGGAEARRRVRLRINAIDDQHLK